MNDRAVAASPGLLLRHDDFSFGPPGARSLPLRPHRQDLGRTASARATVIGSPPATLIYPLVYDTVMIFGPENRPPSATNVVLVVVVVLGLVLSDLRPTKAFFYFITDRRFAYTIQHTGGNIIHNRTVMDFQVNS